MCLFNSGENARATGAMYMGGFVIECLLKALLLERHPNLQGPVDAARLSHSDGEAHHLLFGHRLDEMLDFLPEVRTKFTAMGTGAWERFWTVCEEWTVYARYSPKQAKRQEAGRFLRTIEEVKEWLKHL
jgi:hypothetical protein